MAPPPAVSRRTARRRVAAPKATQRSTPRSGHCAAIGGANGPWCWLGWCVVRDRRAVLGGRRRDGWCVAKVIRCGRPASPTLGKTRRTHALRRVLTRQRSRSPAADGSQRAMVVPIRMHIAYARTPDTPMRSAGSAGSVRSIRRPVGARIPCANAVGWRQGRQGRRGARPSPALDARLPTGATRKEKRARTRWCHVLARIGQGGQVVHPRWSASAQDEKQRRSSNWYLRC